MPLLLSGATADALARQAARLLDFMTSPAAPTGAAPVDAAATPAAGPDTTTSAAAATPAAGPDATTPAAGGDQAAPAALAALAAALATTRTHHAHRAAILSADPDDVRAALTALAEGRPDPAAVTGVAASDPRPVFVFPGQGAQWTGMARDLLDGSAVFRASIDACAAALDPYTGWSLHDALRGAPGAPDPERVDVVQPVLFAVMVSLAAVWRAAGVVPAAVVGHSQGEIAAAYVAGALNLDDAARVVALRSRALSALAGRGGMLSVQLPADALAARLAPYGDRLAVAVVNSPRSAVVAGDPDALDALLAACHADDVRARRVDVDYASHSAQVDAVRADLAGLLAGITPVPAEVPMMSTVTGEMLTGTELDAGYWFTNLRRPVRFADATARLLAAGHRVFLEMSPHPVLATAVEETAEAAGATDTVATGTLRRGEGGPQRLGRSLARAHVCGVAVDWAATGLVTPGRPARLPTYAFATERFWLDEQDRTAAPADADFWRAVDAGDPAALRALGLDGLDADLPALSRWHRDRALHAAADRWSYAVAWRPVPAPQARPAGGSWLVVHPPGAQAEAAAIGAALTRRGVAVTLAGTLEPGGWTGVLSLHALAGPPDPRLPGLGALTATVDLLRAAPAPLWCATRGAVSTGAGDPLTDPAQAQLWGLGRVAALEHPDRWGGLVDLPKHLDDDAADRLAALLTDGGAEDQLAVRPTGVYARRLVPAAGTAVPAAGTAAPAAAPGAVAAWPPAAGTVLITGGTGAVGAHIARDVARARPGVALLLTSRRGADAPGAAELAAQLRELGATVTVAACEAADRTALAALAADAAARGEPIRAVCHAAGAGSTVALADVRAGDLLDGLHTKVAGALALDHVFGDVDAFVLVSSGAGVWGAAGQGPYAAANAFLDALAEHRRSRGLAATAVAWGLWDGAGMAAGEADGMRRRGLVPMAPATAAAALRRLVPSGRPGTVVADLDWPRFTAGFAALRQTRLFTEIPGAEPPASDGAAAPAGSSPPLVARLAGLAAGEARRELRDLVRAQAAAALGYKAEAGRAAADTIAPDRALRELGLDSLTAVDLRNRLVAATGLRLATTLVFDHPTPDRIAAHLLAQLQAAPAATGAAGDDARQRTGAPDEPIAIVGMSCRYPGGADDPDALWQIVATGTDAITTFPGDRGWDIDGLVAGGASHTAHGGFLADPAGFDAEFFGLSPREATTTDPQQRLVLEGAWEAVERAGIDPGTLHGGDTGVFVGVVSHDYADLLRDSAEDFAGHRVTGVSASVISGRVAYALGLTGPAVTVDTACSSSLVAVHLAAQALRAGECGLALAGGVTVMATPTPFVEFSRQGGLAADGRCKPFSAGADGTGWGEGMGMLLLERLSDAERNGHPVLAVVRGCAVNQDGASNGLSAPSGEAQQRVIRAALRGAGLDAADVDAVEAHGTGTVLGDPIEATALLATYGQGRPEGRPCRIGSVKSNIGHTQGAAGVAGIIKMVQALRHAVLPASLHAGEPTPHVDWSAGAVEVLAGSMPWPGGRPRRAAVSAFGISGTNAHVILEEAPPAPVPAPAGRPAADVPLAFPLTARTPAALRDQAARLLAHLDAAPGVALADIAHSLATTRAALAERGTVVAADRDRLRHGLSALAAGTDAANLLRGRVRPDGAVAWMFTGQGSQHHGMGQQLRACLPVFAAAFDEVAAHLPLGEVLTGTDEAAIHRTGNAQPALFAFQVALFRQLTAWGLAPAQLLGHSVGELAAAHCAGVLDLADACRLVAARGRLMQRLPAGGAMLAVDATEAEVTAALGELTGELTGELAGGFAGRVDVAAVNGPHAVVVSGDEDAVEALAARWRTQGRRTRRLRVSHAFHSAHMDPMLEEFRAVAESLTWHAPGIPVVSNVTGAPDLGIATPGYWVRHVRATVRFADGVRWLADRGVQTFVELGPDSVLAGMVSDCLDADDATYVVVPTQRRGRPEPAALIGALAELHGHGVSPDWAVLAGVHGGRVVALPTYAFQRRRFWPRPAAAPAPVAGPLGLQAVEHPMLGAAVPLAGTGAWVFTGRLSTAAQPWLADHTVAGVVIVPGTALLELALDAALRAGAGQVEELAFRTPIRLSGDAGVQVQVSVGAPDAAGRRTLAIHSRPEDATEWVCNAAGLAAAAAPAEADPDLTPWPPTGAHRVDVDGLYERLHRRGYHFGPAFRSLRAAWRRGAELYTEIDLPDGHRPGTAGYGIHPALLDAAAHLSLEGYAERAEAAGQIPILFAINGVRLHRPGPGALRVRLVPAAGEPDGMDLTVADATGRPVARIASMHVRGVAAEQLDPAANGTLLRRTWTPAPTGPPPRQLAVVGRPDPALALPLGDGEVDTYADLSRFGPLVPPVVLAGTAAWVTGTDPVAGTHRAVTAAAVLLQDWLAADRFAGARLAVVTTGAMAVTPGDHADPAQAAVWGLVRAAQAEHPGRFVLVDTDGSAAARRVLPALLGGGAEQLAIRGATGLTPQLTRLDPAADAGQAARQGPATGPATAPFDPDGTVLITGGTGSLGRALAAHLVAEHGVRHLLLAGRRGDPTGLDALNAAGASVTVAACDVADRDQVAALLARIPSRHPLTAVVHAAGIVDDALVADLTPQRIARVLRAKVDGAQHLHDLTRHLPLAAFTLFSSVSGVLGNAGQGNYAAANAYLDALAEQRRALGLPAQSLAWGPWASGDGMADRLDERQLRRIERTGLRPLRTDRALRLYDAARRGDAAMLVAVHLAGQAGTAAPMLAGLLAPRGTTQTAQAAQAAPPVEDLGARLAGLPPTDRSRAVLAVVRAEAALVLGHDQSGEVDPDGPFLESGFNSLMAVELRNRLGAATGLRLPTTLVFECPTPAVLAEYLTTRLRPGQDQESRTILHHQPLSQLESLS
ncbi:SDR family NAD(P)-dependent oxidoreductase [Dactylosporangium sp. NPDC050688]|uniref:SDR family NAD(P)-dependent oxidoreductase n=1 Tax=Dactylosporangium sp. NPDC050688 TaxID=3157217 RepID=UPI0033F8B935